MAQYTLTDEHLKALSRDLLPCPFCGYRSPEVVMNPSIKSSVFCGGCATSTKAFVNSGDAIKLWNTRIAVEKSDA